MPFMGLLTLPLTGPNADLVQTYVLAAEFACFRKGGSMPPGSRPLKAAPPGDRGSDRNGR